jgi:hypothetical protein
MAYTGCWQASVRRCGWGELLAGALETGHTSEGMSSGDLCGYGVACLWLGQLLPMVLVYSVVVALPKLNEPHGFATLGSGKVERVA